ncbi:DUF2071 domain-containing protein [Pedobacter montanisoli]|uniref:DUF2071 domain-containing protein n=1 Tax=Pedobacter montanisoli TaxID=2923277 RepID=A0ABS9ZXF8_9SPHI|nr:DUF2071 domain-containing protein [Pedobacter montanisoli]MCJ0742996.1 DUF2071 domain-containing protein [Pedobacter montanisoli]
MEFLKNHPFAVEAFFNNSLVLTFAVPKEQLQNLIPECLELDTFQNKWAFIAVAMVQTSELRPKGFPKFLGNKFFLIGYRIFVRYTNNSGKRLRGLYIIKSETDKKKMKFFGNIFTHYNYTTTDIQHATKSSLKIIRSEKSKFQIMVEQTKDKIQIPESSPFSDWKDARKFSGPLPYTFTYNNNHKTILIIEGVRQNWKPEPVNIQSYSFDFLDNLRLKNIILASSFEIRNVPYYWKKGKIEKWN